MIEKKLSKDDAISNLLAIKFGDKNNYKSEIKLLSDEILLLADIRRFLDYFKTLSEISLKLEKIRLEKIKCSTLELEENLNKILHVKKLFLEILESNTKLETELLGKLISVTLKMSASDREITKEFGMDFFDAICFHKNIQLEEEQEIKFNELFALRQEIFVNSFCSLILSDNVNSKFITKSAKFNFTNEQEIKIKTAIFDRIKYNGRVSIFEINLLAEQKRSQENIEDFIIFLGKNISIIKNPFNFYWLYPNSEKQFDFVLNLSLKTIRTECPKKVKKFGFHIIQVLCLQDKSYILSDENLILLLTIFSEQREIEDEKVQYRWKDALSHFCTQPHLFTEKSITLVMEKLFLWLSEDKDTTYLEKIYRNAEMLHNHIAIITKIFQENFEKYQSQMLDILEIRARSQYLWIATDVVKLMEMYQALLKQYRADVLERSISSLWCFLQKIAAKCAPEDLKKFILSVTQCEVSKQLDNVLFTLLNNQCLIEDQSSDSKNSLIEFFLQKENIENLIAILEKTIHDYECRSQISIRFEYTYPLDTYTGGDFYHSFGYGTIEYTLDVLKNKLNENISNNSALKNQNKILQQLIFQTEILKSVAQNLTKSEQITLCIEKIKALLQITIQEKQKIFSINMSPLEILQALSGNKLLNDKQVDDIIVTIDENFEKFFPEKNIEETITLNLMMPKFFEGQSMTAANIFLILAQTHHKLLTEDHIDTILKNLNTFLEKYDNWQGKNLIELKKEMEKFDTCIIKLKKMKLEMNKTYNGLKFLDNKYDNDDITDTNDPSIQFF